MSDYHESWEPNHNNKPLKLGKWSRNPLDWALAIAVVAAIAVTVIFVHP